MKKSLDISQFQTFKATISEPFREQLIDWLKVFEEPRAAIKKVIAAIKSLPFVPDSVVFHGLLYDIASGSIEVVVNGYDQS